MTQFNILHIDCSPRSASHSRALSAAIVAQLVAGNPDALIVRRDLGLHPVPHADAEYATALSSPSTLASPASVLATGLSETLIQEVEAADVLVIGTPMNNFTVPSVLKAWIDQILRIGRTMGVSATGEKVGLLKDKPVYVAIASGGVFFGEGARQPDFLTPYLKAAFGCVGLMSVKFLPLQATAFADRTEVDRQQLALLAAATPSNAAKQGGSTTR